MHQKNQPVVCASTLYVIATPIGNLGDITHRALSILKHVDLIAAEDTRHTGLLLQHFNIKTARLFALHDHNESQKIDLLIKKLHNGQAIALVSDAGTPLISDPGYRLVRCCREQGIRVVPLPGACAAIVALSSAGIASDRFCYEGFLPSKPKARQNALKALIEETRTLIFYESPHRIIDSLQDISSIFGKERYSVLARELTKTWESIYGAPVQKLLDWIKEDENRHRGEMVLIVEGYQIKTGHFLPDAALETFRLLQTELSIKKSAALTSKIHHVKKNALYRYALENQLQANLKSDLV